MVKCSICNREFNRITNKHLNTHQLTVDTYIKLYPTANLISEESKLRYSNATKRYFEMLDTTEKNSRYRNRVYSEEGRRKCLESLDAGRKSLDYSDKDRNKMISNAKKEWWANKSELEKSRFIKEKVIPKAKERLGEDVWRAQLREKGLKGYQALMSKGSKKQLNNFEQEMIDLIVNRGYKCTVQFEIDKWFYDCYIPEKNLIVEFDGDYWHPKTLEDCTNSRLKKQWIIDRKKENLAKQKGYNLTRIRESEKNQLLNLL